MYDVIIIGAGPAGCTAANLLAQEGHKVLVLEKETFPRFHIGESLLPACLPVLKRMGVEPVEDAFIYKRGARFVCEESGRDQTFAFSETLPGCVPHAWQVERAKFDTQLRDRAREVGAEIRHEQTVTSYGIEEDSAWIETADGREEARFLLDASGQQRLMARRMKSVDTLPDFGKTSVFTHYEGLSEEALEELGPGFEICIMIRESGWGWIIPLSGGRISVGIAGPGNLTKKDLDEGLLSGPMMTRLAKGAERKETKIIADFSYKNTAPHGARYSAIGDANSFLDPVFSSGVTVALRTSEALVDILSPALKAGTEGAPDLLEEHQASTDRAVKTFHALIHRFYHSNFVNSFFLQEAPQYEMRKEIVTVLAGDVWRYDNPFQDLLLKSRPRKPRKPTTTEETRA